MHISINREQTLHFEETDRQLRHAKKKPELIHKVVKVHIVSCTDGHIPAAQNDKPLTKYSFQSHRHLPWFGSKNTDTAQPKTKVHLKMKNQCTLSLLMRDTGSCNIQKAAQVIMKICGLKPFVLHKRQARQVGLTNTQQPRNLLKGHTFPSIERKCQNKDLR